MDTSDAWEAYCAAEKLAFEAAAAALLRYSPTELVEIHAQALEAGSDIATVIDMMHGLKILPEGWRIARTPLPND